MRTLILYFLSVAVVAVLAFSSGKLHERKTSAAAPAEPAPAPRSTPLSVPIEKRKPKPEPAEEEPGDTLPDTPAIIASASAQLATPSVTQAGLLEVHRLINKIAPEDIAAALAEIEALPHGSSRQSLTAAVVSRWAATDGQAAMTYTLTKLNHANRPAALAGALSSWSENDPEGALAWFQAKTTSDPDFELVIGAKPEYLLPTIFEGLVAKDPSTALASFSRLARIEDKNQALDGIAAAALNDDQTQRVLELATSTLGGDARAARLRIVAQWGKRAPAAAAAWVSQVRDPTEKSQLARSVAQTWIAFEPTTAVPWLLDNTPQAERANVVELATSIWVNSDPNATAEWLATLPKGTDSDLGVATLSRHIVAIEPETSLDWAKTIDNEQLRFNTMIAVIGQWRLREPEVAVESLRQSGLPAAEIEEYLKRTVPAK